MFHKKTILLFVMALLLCAIFISYLGAQSHYSNVASSRLLESFDVQQDSDSLVSGYEWQVRASRFITHTEDKKYPAQAYIAGYNPVFLPSAMQGSTTEEDQRLFAVRAAFNLKGTNYLYLIPTDTDPVKKEGKAGVFTYEKDARDGKSFKKGDVIPGIYLREVVEGVGIYALGILKDYYVDIEFQNFYGEVFLVSLGNLNYKGWKILEGNIPFYKYVSTRDLVTNDYYLRLNKIIIRTGAGEAVNDFDLFFDSLFVTVPMQEDSSDFYDGYQLTKPNVRDSFFSNDEETNEQ